MTAIIPLLIMSVLAGVAIGVFIWTQIRSESAISAQAAADPTERQSSNSDVP